VLVKRKGGNAGISRKPPSGKTIKEKGRDVGRAQKRCKRKGRRNVDPQFPTGEEEGEETFPDN